MQIWYIFFRYTCMLFLGCAFLLADYNITRASWKTKKERLSYRKKYKEEFVSGTSLFWLHALLSMSFSVAFFVFSLPFPKKPTCWMIPIKIHNIVMVGILCDDTISEQSKIWLQSNTSWLTSLETWYYFRLCFSFSCSGYDVTLIKKAHIATPFYKSS